MPISYAYSLASTDAGLNTPLAIQPSEVRYLPPDPGPENLLGQPTLTSTKEGRELIWAVAPVEFWTTLWLATGGDSAPFINGYIRCVDFGASGASDRWGDYRCVIWRPTSGMFAIHRRLQVIVRVTRMQRLHDAHD